MPTRIRADQNCDGLVNAADFSAWQSNYNNGDLRADQNGDEALSPSDFSAFVANFNLGMQGPYGPAYGCGEGTLVSNFLVEGILPETWQQPVTVFGFLADGISIGSVGSIIDLVVIDAPYIGRSIFEDRFVSGDDPAMSPPVGQVDRYIIEYKIGAFKIRRSDLTEYSVVGLVHACTLERHDDATGSLIFSSGHVADGISVLGIYGSFTEAIQDLIPYADLLDLEIENPYPGSNGYGNVILTVSPVGDVVLDIDNKIITGPDPRQLSCSQLHPDDCPARVACVYDRAVAMCLENYKTDNAQCAKNALWRLLREGGGGCLACLLTPPPAVGPCCLVAVTVGTVETSLAARRCGLDVIEDKKRCLASAALNYEGQMAGCQ